MIDNLLHFIMIVAFGMAVTSLVFTMKLKRANRKLVAANKSLGAWSSQLAKMLNEATKYIRSHQDEAAVVECPWCHPVVEVQRFHARILTSDDPVLAACADHDCSDGDCRIIDDADAVPMWPITPLTCADPECTEPSCRRQDPGA